MQNNNVKKSQNSQNSISEPEETIGQIIKNARLEKGVELLTASTETKLKVAYLVAIENDNFDELPAPIYAKNFIRIYANFLGLDGVEISKRYNINTTDIDIPQDEKTSLTYHVSSFFHLIFRHPFLLLGLVVVLIILFFYSGGSYNTEPDEEISFSTTVPQSTSLEDYQPVFDLKEPFPKS